LKISILNIFPCPVKKGNKKYNSKKPERKRNLSTKPDQLHFSSINNSKRKKAMPQK
jgi:hypothetical protein